MGNAIGTFHEPPPVEELLIRLGEEDSRTSKDRKTPPSNEENKRQKRKSFHTLITLWEFLPDRNDKLFSENRPIPLRNFIGFNDESCYVALRVYAPQELAKRLHRSHSHKHSSKTSAKQEELFPVHQYTLSMVELAISAKQLLSPRGQASSFGGRHSMGSSLRSEQKSRSSPQYDLYVWNGKEASSLIKSHALAKAFDLDTALKRTRGRALSAIFFSPDRSNYLELSEIIQFEHNLSSSEWKRQIGANHLFLEMSKYVSEKRSSSLSSSKKSSGTRRSKSKPKLISPGSSVNCNLSLKLGSTSNPGRRVVVLDPLELNDDGKSLNLKVQFLDDQISDSSDENLLTCSTDFPKPNFHHLNSSDHTQSQSDPLLTLIPLSTEPSLEPKPARKPKMTRIKSKESRLPSSSKRNHTLSSTREAKSKKFVEQHSKEKSSASSKKDKESTRGKLTDFRSISMPSAQLSRVKMDLGLDLSGCSNTLTNGSPATGISSSLKIDLSSLPNAQRHSPSQGNSPQNPLENKATKIARYDRICSKITDSLYLGSDTIARDLEALQQSGITHVLNCAGTVCGNYHPSELKYKSLYLCDGTKENISCLFYDVLEFLDDAIRQQGAVFVHCHQGISRSSAMVILYLMWKEQRPFQETHERVKSFREIANPNAGFTCQLLNWWSERLRFSSESSLVSPSPPQMYYTVPHCLNCPNLIALKTIPTEKFSPESLDSRGCFLVRCVREIFVWRGELCPEVLFESGMKYANRLIRFEYQHLVKDRGIDVPVHVELQSQESTGFLELFSEDLRDKFHLVTRRSWYDDSYGLLEHVTIVS